MNEKSEKWKMATDWIRKNTTLLATLVGVTVGLIEGNSLIFKFF